MHLMLTDNSLDAFDPNMLSTSPLVRLRFPTKQSHVLEAKIGVSANLLSYVRKYEPPNALIHCPPALTSHSMLSASPARWGLLDYFGIRCAVGVMSRRSRYLSAQLFVSQCTKPKGIPYVGEKMSQTVARAIETQWHWPIPPTPFIQCWPDPSKFNMLEVTDNIE